MSSSPPPLPDDELTPGQSFAGYEIIGLLGSGGMGRVYLVQHPRLPRRDALKLLPSDWSADTEYRARFNREADLASTLWHPNIVGVHDRGEADGQLWISMDYVDGLDAARLVAERYPAGMPAEDVARIVTAVASALDSAHKRGLLHRDVKPANIMLTHLDDDGEQRILLTDFGIARDLNDVEDVTASTTAIGTVAYCAPEQLNGDEVGGRADQYALAATAYHLLTGEPLFPSSEPAEVIRDHLNTKPPALAARRPELSALDPVLTIALAKRPESRFARCSDFARALTEQIGALGSPPAQAPPTGVRPMLGEPLTVDPRAIAPRPNHQLPAGPIAAAAAAGLAVVAIAVWLLWPADDGADPPSGPAPGTSTTPRAVNTQAQQQLRAALPPGYPPSACTSLDVPPGAAATLGCTQNGDAGGPPAATYTLASDAASLDSAFGAVVGGMRVVNCPGNIQSPVHCPTGVSNMYRAWCQMMRTLPVR
ncbi:serine/threonine protein kinase [Mycobacterium antarcticum]|uniref:serine/threonine protein kinase n=1 Tax=Mycolicibacterium sp. TUM20983 TaxID=3023369 RepID=UPI0023994232|nr:serine/threonine protein kinase [Mycolicibacterium sp. TUM20983]GLP73562.1 serine/threonine protein kinase [Mycolicibacterium sp. TUM20983]